MVKHIQTWNLDGMGVETLAQPEMDRVRGGGLFTWLLVLAGGCGAPGMGEQAVDRYIDRLHRSDPQNDTGFMGGPGDGGCTTIPLPI